MIPAAVRLRTRHDIPIARLALPALGALAADPLVSLVDTAFVGRLGPSPLAALGVASAVFGVAFVLFNFLAYGTTPLVASAVGRGDDEAAGRIVMHGLVIAGAVGLAVTAVLEAAGSPLLRVMGAAGAEHRLALDYLRIRAAAAPAVLIVTLGHGAFRGYQDTWTPLLVTLGLNAVNLVLDPLLIFGAGLGVSGAALATLAAQWVGAGWFLYLLTGPRHRRPGVEGFRPRRREMTGFLAVGRDVAIRTLALLAVLTMATAVAARVGTAAVAAHQVAVQVFVFLALTVDALAIAAQAMVGRLVGAGVPGEARAVSNRLLVLGLLAGLALAGLLWAVGGYLPGWFTQDGEVRAALESVYPLLVAIQPLGALVFVWDGILLGAGAFRFLAVAMVGAALVAGGVMAAVLPLGWGLVGVWWGMLALIVVRAAVLGGWYARAGNRPPG